LDTPPSSRDDQGRFQPGCAPGPGRPRGRANMLQRAAEEAISPEMVSGMVRRAARQGLEGNVAATKMVLDRVCGRPPEAQPEGTPADIGMPRLLSAPDCAAAIDRVIAAMTAGTVDLPTAKFLLDAVERRRKAIETIEHEERLTDLEQAASNIDFGKR
jgi:hypothetical protein